VTEQAAAKPLKPLWEFSDPGLGVTNVGAAIVKAGGRAMRCSNDATRACSLNTDCVGAGQCVSTDTNNGRWFAVLASGSTGPIVDKEFRGTSNQNLKVFVLDLKTGVLLRTIDTGIANAFAGSISSSMIDFEKNSTNVDGTYQDDAVYIGYVQNVTAGGVVRLAINDDIDPAHWTVSKVFTDGEIGPVTSAVRSVLDRTDGAGKLWLYFGEGRYFYKQDDLPTQRKIFGVQDPCFRAEGGGAYSIDHTCTTELRLSDLQNQSTPTAWTPGSRQGWYIQLNTENYPTPEYSAERVISNPVIASRGAVFFVSFAPTSDICGVGGLTYIRARDYQSGDRVKYILEGTALTQSSTGEIKEINLAALQNGDVSYPGMPPTEGDPLQIFSNPNQSIQQFMHIQED
jgi:type IV pilus assembly protein PilY1